MKQYVITISRQFGSLGRSIAQALSKELGVDFYDRDIVEQTAKRMGAAGVGDQRLGRKFQVHLFPPDLSPGHGA